MLSEISILGLSVCGGCHGSEVVAPQITFAKAFESDIFKPRSSEEVELDLVRQWAANCDAASEPERCAILQAIFGHGKVNLQHFSVSARTIYD